MALFGSSHSKLIVFKYVDNGEVPETRHIHGLIQLPLGSRKRKHNEMAVATRKAHLIRSAVSEHSDRNVLAGNFANFHGAVLMVLGSERETGANSALRAHDSVAAEKVGRTEIPGKIGEHKKIEIKQPYMCMEPPLP